MKTSFEQSTYMKIYHMIANDITVGVYKAGDIIPTQVELAKKYDVSRATITEAVKELTRRKLVKTQRGKGTFVIVQPLEIGNFKRFDGFSSFRSKHRDRNLTDDPLYGNTPDWYNYLTICREVGNQLNSDSVFVACQKNAVLFGINRRRLRGIADGEGRWNNRPERNPAERP